MELDKNRIIKKYERVRNLSESLCESLEIEDYIIQSMPDASPIKWHLAHTSWAIENFLLKSVILNYETIKPEYEILFNSYYNSIGKQYYRPERGVISRPTVKEIFEYRKYVDQHFYNWIDQCNEESLNSHYYFIELALNHEQQHQELMLTDLKHAFSKNPAYPVFNKNYKVEESGQSKAITWINVSEGLYKQGFSEDSFSYDNEKPEHRIFLEAYQIADRLITNAEYINFIEDQGYNRHELWLSQAWDVVRNQQWEMPLYWKKEGKDWYHFTLNGYKKVNPDAPVCHVSYYEADAYARWANARLPLEGEWEVVAGTENIIGNFLDDRTFEPIVCNTLTDSCKQLFGDVWEWTMSHYSPYPGFKISEGAVGEYNGKFMANQFVLKGGSCVTSKDHIRVSYRNFFYGPDQWQFSGIRLVRNMI